MMSSLSVNSRRPYLVRSLCEFWMWPVILLNSSFVSVIVFDDCTKKFTQGVKKVVLIHVVFFKGYKLQWKHALPRDRLVCSLADTCADNVWLNRNKLSVTWLDSRTKSFLADFCRLKINTSSNVWWQAWAVSTRSLYFDDESLERRLLRSTFSNSSFFVKLALRRFFWDLTWMIQKDFTLVSCQYPWRHAEYTFLIDSRNSKSRVWWQSRLFHRLARRLKKRDSEIV